MNTEKEQPSAPTKEKSLIIQSEEELSKWNNKVEVTDNKSDFHLGWRTCFDWINPKLQERDREIAFQKQLTKDEVKRVSDVYQSVIDELKKKYELH